jgi:hypothetical protein
MNDEARREVSIRPRIKKLRTLSAKNQRDKSSRPVEQNIEFAELRHHFTLRRESVLKKLESVTRLDDELRLKARLKELDYLLRRL